ncbi:uncharacterized protein RCC_10141 [Ramularia collo-cygni]|uniref:Uncharacterized protein n=1 Tax=Ramularia collo-cygni TaxID=112498 RepID=A0A2D3V4V8_9PEZI|nr:uncharacterized protein RCC_10141 [Ramularia collo-cygni]CZT24416.1 uncharacterized protein RCC_10141 [Ramularia collo-cygni]
MSRFFTLHMTLMYLTLYYPWTAAQDTSQCYWPDGTVADRMIPCDPTGNITVSCCAKTDLCLQNNMCFSATGGIWRKGCTDQSWKDVRCTGATDCARVLSGQSDLTYRCGRGTEWACDRTGNGAAVDCQDNFTLSGPWDILIRPDQIPSQSVTTPAILDPSSGLQGLPALTVTVTTTPPVRFSTTTVVVITGSAGSTSDERDQGGKSNVGAIAGGTVGGVVALIFLGVGAWFVVSRRGKSKTESQRVTADTSAHNVPEQYSQSDSEPQKRQLQEAEGNGLHEADGRVLPAEADHMAIRVPELEGDPYMYRR